MMERRTFGTEAFLAALLILWVLVLLGCNTGDRPHDGRAPTLRSRTGGNLAIRFHQGLGKQGPGYLDWWQETLDGWSDQARASTNLAAPAYTEIHIFKDNSYLQWYWARQTAPVGVGLRPRIEAWINPAGIQGYVFQGNVYVVQGREGTTDGFALHLLSHIMLQRQAPNVWPDGDWAHAHPDWGLITPNLATGWGWDAEYWAYAAALQATR